MLWSLLWAALGRPRLPPDPASSRWVGQDHSRQPASAPLAPWQRGLAERIERDPEGLADLRTQQDQRPVAGGELGCPLSGVGQSPDGPAQVAAVERAQVLRRVLEAQDVEAEPRAG